MTANLLLAAGCVVAMSTPIVTRFATEVGVMENRSTLDLALICVVTLAVYATVERWSLRDQRTARRADFPLEKLATRSAAAPEKPPRAA